MSKLDKPPNGAAANVQFKKGQKFDLVNAQKLINESKIRIIDFANSQQSQEKKRMPIFHNSKAKGK